MRRSIVLVLTVLTASAALAAAAAPPFRRQTPASVEEVALPDGVFHRKIVQPRYEFFTLWPDPGAPGEPEPILLEQIFRISENTDQEGSPSALEAIAWRSSKGGKSRYDTRLWAITVEANEADMLRYGEFYRTTEYGCCASENVQRIYDLRTGKLAAVSTVKPGVVEVPNTPVRRLVGYHSTAGVVGPPEAEDEKLAPRLLGVLTLSARAEVLHRVAVMDTIPLRPDGVIEREPFSPDLILRVDGKDGDVGTDVSLWSAEKNPVPANLGGYRVELTFASEAAEVVRIPVVADDFDLANSTVPPTLKLVRVK